MKPKILSVVFSVLFAASLCLNCDYVQARAGSDGTKPKSSSSRPSKPVTGGYGNSSSKPGSNSAVSPSSPSAPRAPSGGGYGNTATRPPSPGGSESQGTKPGYGNSAVSGSGGSPADSRKPRPVSSVQEKMNRSFSKQESLKAYEAYTAQKARFQKTVGSGYQPNAGERSTLNTIRGGSSYSSTDYYARRTVFYDTGNWHAPGYVYYSYGSFGIWDAMLLWFMLDHIQDRQYAQMYYHHRDDPGMQQFRKELDRLSSENTELKEKVKKLDESNKALEQEGVKIDPNYVAPDAAGIALAAEFAETPGAGKKSSGFPWGWVAIIAIAVLGFFYMRRRKSWA